MPPKHQPDYSYLRQVPLSRVHLFTAIQLACFAVLWLIQVTTSIQYPAVYSTYSSIEYLVATSILLHQVCSSQHYQDVSSTGI